MKRIFGSLLALSLLAWGGAALSHEHEESGAQAAAPAAAPHTMTVTGEIVDTGCYLGHGAKGAKHKGCAATCVAKGMPIGLLTDQGDLYLLTPPHGNMDSYKKARDWAGNRVEVTGPMLERNGMKAIEVASAKQAPATQAAQ